MRSSFTDFEGMGISQDTELLGVTFHLGYGPTEIEKHGRMLVKSRSTELETIPSPFFFSTDMVA